MIKIKLQENQKILQEITMEQALEILDSKATRKQIYKILYNFKASNGYDKETLSNLTVEDWMVEDLKKAIQNVMPDDIEENDKARTAIWLKNQFLGTWGQFLLAKERDGFTTKRMNIERFYQWKNFIEPREKRDINKIESFYELWNIVDGARPRYEAYLSKRAYLDADAGSELIFENDKWKVYIPQNKGAACQLGKGTDWCTAAPGLDYYEHYHKPNDPLFIFINKQNESEKYQFHYGTTQFMDSKDAPLLSGTYPQEELELFEELHMILVFTVGDKYPIINRTITKTSLGLSKVTLRQTGELLFDEEIRFIDLLRKIYWRDDNKTDKENNIWAKSLASVIRQRVGERIVEMMFIWREGTTDTNRNQTYEGWSNIHIKFDKETWEFRLVKALCYDQNGNCIAGYYYDQNPNGNPYQEGEEPQLVIRNKRTWEYSADEHEFFEKRIKGRESEFAKEIYDQNKL